MLLCWCYVVVVLVLCCCVVGCIAFVFVTVIVSLHRYVLLSLFQVPQHMGTSWSGSFKLGGDSARDLQIEMQPGQTANNTLVKK